jgi:hypothetical protein
MNAGSISEIGEEVFGVSPAADKDGLLPPYIHLPVDEAHAGAQAQEHVFRQRMMRMAEHLPQGTGHAMIAVKRRAIVEWCDGVHGVVMTGNWVFCKGNSNIDTTNEPLPMNGMRASSPRPSPPQVCGVEGGEFVAGAAAPPYQGCENHCHPTSI